MTEPLTTRRVVEHLGELSRRLDELTDRYYAADQDAAHKREYATWTESRAFVATEGPMEMRKHEARVQSHDARLAASTAEATLRGLKQQIDSLKLRIEVGRSTGTALRAEVSLAESGMQP